MGLKDSSSSWVDKLSPLARRSTYASIKPDIRKIGLPNVTFFSHAHLHIYIYILYLSIYRSLSLFLFLSFFLPSSLYLSIFLSSHTLSFFAAFPSPHFSGLILSVVGGICYGMTFDPSQYVLRRALAFYNMAEGLVDNEKFSILNFFFKFTMVFHALFIRYVMDNHKGASQDALKYAFSQYCGIFMASTFYFIAYCCEQLPIPML